MIPDHSFDHDDLVPELLRLENQLCFALYSATRAITKSYRKKLAPMGLTYPQYLALIVLWRQDGSTISEIGDKLMLDSGTLTPLIKRLERMDIVRRERNSQDQREVNVWLQPKGLELKDAALDARQYVACRLGMSEQEILALRSDLMALISQLESPETDADEPVLERAEPA
ncbi:MAG: MarR family winged helix-turn-helix transcriptional regulator [Geminicoccaceae bacterium]